MPSNAGGKYSQGGNANYGAVTLSSGSVRVTPTTRTRVSIVLRNVGTANVYVGRNSSVTTSTGFLIQPGEQMEFPDYVGELWVAASASADVRYFEVL